MAAKYGRWALVVRFCAALALVQTAFNPDEYWQALEPAHCWVFGYGHLTWEWHERIRSPVHVVLVAAVYKVMQGTGLDDTTLLVAAPRLMQACFAAWTDVSTQQLAQRLFGERVAWAAWLLSITAWFNLFAATRTLANSLETALTTAALASWPWPGASAIYSDQRSMAQSLGLAALSVVMRPTAALIWVPLALHFVVSAHSNQQRASFVVTAALCGLAALLASFALDSVYYGAWTLSAWNFVQFNVVHNISVFYGSHPWHWYLTEGVPIVTMGLLPCALYGWNKTRGSAGSVLGWAALFVIASYSCLGHKEFRFIHPLLPIVCIYAACAMSGRSRTLWALLVGSQVVVALYLGLVHQRGVIDVMHWLRFNGRQNMTMVQLMPCHSTPWQAHLHRPDASIRFLTCEPPPIGVAISEYLDEADRFYQDPVHFVSTEMPVLPDYVLLFEALLPTIAPVLEAQQLTLCARFFNAHFTDDARRQGDVLVYCRP